MRPRSYARQHRRRAAMLAAGQCADLSHNRLAEIVACIPGILDFSSLLSATRLRSCDKALRVLVAEFAWGSDHSESGPTVRRLDSWNLCFPAATAVKFEPFYLYGREMDIYKQMMRNQVLRESFIVCFCTKLLRYLNHVVLAQLTSIKLDGRVVTLDLSVLPRLLS